MTERWHTTGDGIRLFARDEGPQDCTLAPLLCLAGLTRNSRDFDPIFDRYASARRVIAIDFRGRGRSEHARDPQTYRVDAELQDTLEVLKALDIPKVALLGTSRGGIVGLLMAATAKPFLAGLMLNDIGCELEIDGLLRITDYVGTRKYYPTWDAAAKAFAEGSHGFSGVAHEQWLHVVKRVYIETKAGICPSHDPRLAETFPSSDDIKSGKIGALWSILPALQNLPFSVMRGDASDLLSSKTVGRMKAQAPHLVAHVIPQRGHVPFLDEAESVSAIDDWLAQVDK